MSTSNIFSQAKENTQSAPQQEIVCKHMKYINPLEDIKFKSEKFKVISKLLENEQNHFYSKKILFDGRERRKQNQDEYSANFEEWYCLHDGCESIFPKKGSEPTSVLRHFENSEVIEENHCLLINCQTTMIMCIDCNTEIYDLPMYAPEIQSLIKDWCNPKKIRDIFHQQNFDWESNLLKSNMSNPKSHWKSSKGLCGLLNVSNSSWMNCIVQIFRGIPILRKVFKKMYAVYSNIGEGVAPKSLTRRVSFQLTKLMYQMGTGQQRVELQIALYQFDSSLRGYGFKDSFDFFKKFVNILHDDLKYIGKKTYDMRRSCPVSKEKQDEWEVIQNIKDYCDYSLISQTFKGKLCVRASCTQCESVYWCEEDFMGVSLEIPPKDWKSSNTQWGFENNTKQSTHSASNQAQEKDNSNIFTKIFQKNKPQNVAKKEGFSLYECLAYYCENSVLSEKKQFFCDCCKTKVNVSKNCNLLTLPNILCIQLSRFKILPTGQTKKNNTPIDFPLDDLELSYFIKPFEIYEQNITLYDLIGVVCHFGQEGGDEYSSYVKHEKNGLFYKFVDSQLKTVEQPTSKDVSPYLLFYKLKQKPDNALFRNIHSQVKLLKQGEMSLKKDQGAYLPGFWYEKLRYLSSPGPIHTQHLICSHNKIKPDFYDCFPPKNSKSAQSLLLAENSMATDKSTMSMLEETQDNIIEIDPNDTHYSLDFLKIQSVLVPQEFVHYVTDTYGGGQIIQSSLEICSDCCVSARNLKRRRKLEQSLMIKYDKKFTEETYIMDENWIAKWKEFLYSNKKFFKRNFVKGMPPPGPIDNKQLLGPQNVLKQGMKRNVNFRIVNDYIWQIFKLLYGGGPALVINDYNSRKKNYQKPALAKGDYELITEMLLLLDEKKYNEAMKNILSEEPTSNLKQNIQQQSQIVSQFKQIPPLNNSNKVNNIPQSNFTSTSNHPNQSSSQTKQNTSFQSKQSSQNNNSKSNTYNQQIVGQGRQFRSNSLALQNQHAMANFNQNRSQSIDLSSNNNPSSENTNLIPLKGTSLSSSQKQQQALTSTSQGIDVNANNIKL